MKQEKPKQPPKTKTRKLKIPLHKQLKNKKLKQYLTCEICGDDYKNLAAHITHYHKITTEEYKEQFPETEYFLSEVLRDDYSQQRTGFLTSENRYLRQKEIDYVVQNYMNMSKRELAEHLHLSETTIAGIIDKYVIEVKQINEKYTEEEEQYIRENYKTKTYAEMGEVLHREIDAVVQKLIKMGLKKDGEKAPGIFYKNGAPEPGINENRGWGTEELNYLKKNLMKKQIQEIAAFLGRSEKGVIRKVEALGLERLKAQNEHYSHWSEKELNYLKKNYGNEEIECIVIHLNRSRYSIYHKARELGLKHIDAREPYSDKEIKYIKKNYKKQPYREIAEHLGRSTRSVTIKIHELGLKKYDPGKPYTEKEVQFVKKNYSHMTASELGAELNRTKASIKKLIVKYGISKGRM